MASPQGHAGFFMYFDNKRHSAVYWPAKTLCPFFGNVIAQRVTALLLTAPALLLSLARSTNEDAFTKRFHPDRTADCRRDHRHHRGHRRSRSASRPHVGQRSVCDRVAARHQHGAAELLAA